MLETVLALTLCPSSPCTCQESVMGQSWSEPHAAPPAPQPTSVLSSECTPSFQEGLGPWAAWGLPALRPALICCLEKHWRQSHDPLAVYAKVLPRALCWELVDLNPFNNCNIYGTYCVPDSTQYRSKLSHVCCYSPVTQVL